jgi:hypothetical protein
MGQEQLKNCKSSSAIDDEEYLSDYSLLISLAGQEFGSSFAAIASPTLSKQETVTDLYDTCLDPSLELSYKWRAFKYFLQFPFRISWHLYNLLALSYIYRVASIPKSCIYIRSWLVPQSFSGEGIRDEYFRGLTDDLKGCESVVLALQPLKYKYAWNARGYKLPKDCIMPIGLLRPIDIVKCLVEYIFTARIAVSGKYILRDKDISQKINLALLNDYFGMRSFLAYLEKWIAEKLVDAQIKSFIYVFENQSWEKSYCRVFKDHKICTIGYQSSGFSKRFLNFLPNHLDEKIQPQPDFLLTVGDGFSKYLLEFGCYRSKIITFAALRFDHLSLNQKYFINATSSELKNQVLYAFPVHGSQYGRIYSALLEAFENSSIKIDLKLHPLNIEKYKDIFSNLPNNFRIVKSVENKQLSSLYDLVLFNDNSYGIESLIFGVKSYELDIFNNDLDERLIYFNAWKHRINLEKLKELRNSIENATLDKDFDSIAMAEYINLLYRPYNGDLSLLLGAINSSNNQNLH